MYGHQEELAKKKELAFHNMLSIMFCIFNMRHEGNIRKCPCLAYRNKSGHKKQVLSQDVIFCYNS